MPASPGRPLGRLLILSTLTALGLGLGLGTASAHVTVNPGTAVAGSYTALTFRVPNESAKADTVGITVSFPADHPFASVSVKKQPGWTATVTRTKLSTPIRDDDNLTITEAVSSISWKADAQGQIALGQFAEFEISVGPVPDAPTLSFPTSQNYSDGTVVNWNEPTPASGAEPEHPAPTLTISAAAGGTGEQTSPASSEAGTTSALSGPSVVASDPATSGSGAATGSGTATQPQAVDPAATDNAARTLAVIGIVIAALALLVGALGLRKRRRSQQ